MFQLVYAAENGNVRVNYLKDTHLCLNAQNASTERQGSHSMLQHPQIY